MKTYLTALSTTALISMAPFALAASSTDLTVTGLITPSACTPSLSNGGIVDNGKVSVKDLDPIKDTLIGIHPLQLTVACEASTLLALDSTDNRAGSGTQTGWFGLGLTDAGEKLGSFLVDIKQTLADSVIAQAIVSDDDGRTWFKGWAITPDDLTSVGSAADHTQPIAVKDLTMDLSVWTYIAPADSLTLTDDVIMDGSATLTVKYL